METFTGYDSVALVDGHDGVTFPMAVMYPTSVPEKTERLGPYRLAVAMDAVPKVGVFPLILISHGSGGSHLVYRTLAYHLARHGFVVGMPEHPFNNRNNNTLEGTVKNLTNRPRHLQTAIDWFFSSEKFVPYLKPDNISIIGHSLGGYTALAMAGGVATSFSHEAPNGQSQKIHVVPDSRVKALVLLAPASVWFRNDGALLQVRVPILMLVGEKDPYTPANPHTQLILDGVPDASKVQYRIIENAGHFSFLSRFPESITHAAFAPSQDPAGFHRERFLNELNAEVLAFLLHKT